MPHLQPTARHTGLVEQGKERDKPNEDDKPLGMDERVSFYPMEPDEVLRRLLRTPPVHRRGDQEPPDEESAAE